MTLTPSLLPLARGTCNPCILGGACTAMQDARPRKKKKGTDSVVDIRFPLRSSARPSSRPFHVLSPLAGKMALARSLDSSNQCVTLRLRLAPLGSLAPVEELGPSTQLRNGGDGAHGCYGSGRYLWQRFGCLFPGGGLLEAIEAIEPVLLNWQYGLRYTVCTVYSTMVVWLSLSCQRFNQCKLAMAILYQY